MKSKTVWCMVLVGWLNLHFEASLAIGEVPQRYSSERANEVNSKTYKSNDEPSSLEHYKNQSADSKRERASKD